MVYPVTRAHEGEVRWIAHACRPVVDADGNPSGRRASNRDITDRKSSEIERIDLERHLEQQQKLETVGVLASSVAHDINSPLTGIISYAYMIKNDEEEADSNEQYADEIVHEATRIAGMVKSLLSLSRVSQDDRQTFSPVEIVDGVDLLVRTILRQDQITLQLDIPDHLPKILCAKEQVQQVLLNLIMNARDALNAKYEGADTRKVIVARAHQFNDEKGRWVRFSVEDQGLGISQELQQRMFNPFFTTKPRGQGTGLGLSISRRIVEDHSGRISVDSQLGEWTRFDIDLPIHAAQQVKRLA